MDTTSTDPTTTEATPAADVVKAAETPLKRDGKMLARQALSAIQAAINTTFGRVEATIPQLTGDVAAFAEGWIDKNAHDQSATVLKGLLGIARPFEGSLSAAAVAGLVEVNHIIDARLVAFQGT
jgi:hypothetical protein